MSLSTFIKSVEKGVALSNNYDVDFDFTGKDKLTSWLKNAGVDYGSDSSVVKLLCDEAQLPNVQAATGQVTGKFLGEGQVNYPHTKLYSDFQLGWMCDVNMTPLKFLNAWYSYIFKEYDSSGKEIALKKSDGGNLTSLKNLSNASRERSVRLSWPSEYQASVIITKTDRGKSAPNERASMSYSLLNVFPYSIDAVPLSYGASQIAKVTANFYYSKHIVTYNNL